MKIAALIAVAALPAAPPRPMPLVASHPVAGSQMQSRSWNYTRPFFQHPNQDTSTCRVRAFFGTGVAKPLETVYFSRPGSPCPGVPFYGFVFLTR